MSEKKISAIIVFFIALILISAGYYILLQSDSKNNHHRSDDDYSPPIIDKSSKELLESLTIAGNYLVNATNDDGSFVYEYNASHNWESSSYNILRHAGTIYSMLQLYISIKDEQLLSASERAIEYLLSFSVEYDNATCIAYKDEIKLGGNALAIIALAEHAKATGDNKNLLTMQNLAKYIKQSQKESGEFISKRFYSTGEVSDFVSQYYPGEALLSLCRLYSLDYNETWLDLAEKGAQYLINVRDAGVSTNDLIHDHWLLMALNELYRYRESELYLNHSMRIAESIIYKQRDGVNREAEHPDWLGSYYTPPGSTSTAARSEGLIAAYHLAVDFGDNDTASRILDAIKLGVEFQFRTQFTSDNVEDLPDPQRAIGGFHESLNCYDIRIDYVQHNICSILGLYNILQNN